MSQYLRDEFLKNLTLSEEALRKINAEIVSIQNQINAKLDMASADENIKKQIILVHYVIRFDSKGFRLFDFESAMKHFQDAYKIERFIFILESIENVRSNKLTGKNLELSFDSQNSANCKLTVQDDDINWVDFVFCKLKERLSKYKNTNFIIQNRYASFIVQLLGVVFGLIISFWAANKIAPHLSIDNALGFSFLISLILFSNIWTLLYEGILRFLNYLWPNISFRDQGGLHWIVKALISSSFVALTFFVFSRLFIYFSEMIKSILK